MSRIILTNLGMVLTEKCNLNCAHCMRYGSGCHSMTPEIMQKVFEQVSLVGNLNVCGGEPFIDTKLFEQLVSLIITNGLPIFSFSLITNGTLYNEEYERLLDDMDKYISIFSSAPNRCKVLLSMDKYHKDELNRLKLTNPELAKKYYDNMRHLMANSKHFYGFNTPKYIFDAGNAQNLDVAKIPVKAKSRYYCTYKDSLLAGPSLFVLSDGVVSECDGDFATLKEQFNYGNVNDQSLEEIIKSSSKKLSRSKFKQMVK